ncbi:MAG: glycosyltransferase [Bacteroidales bacterium]|nr:glycosyltransferase [Bacteroidales bacterium]
MKLLILLSRVPWPVEKGDKLRAFHQIRCLSLHHEIHLFAVSDTKDNAEAHTKLSAYCSSVTFVQRSWSAVGWNVLRAFFSGKPLQTGLFYSRNAKNALHSLVEKIQPDHLYCQLIRVADLAKGLAIPSTIDFQDVMSVNILRRKKASPWWMKPVMAMEYRRLLRYEKEIFDRFDHHTIISFPDRDLMPFAERDTIHVIPNGVDYSYFYPVDEPKDVDILFTGNMGYPPNIDASEFLVNEILPLVHQELPETKVMLAGANPHVRVQHLESSMVQVTGWVDDIRDCYVRARVFVAPMRIGTGLQNKLLEAMAMQIPCITTELANSALGAIDGRAIFIANEAKSIAAYILTLLKNPSLANCMAEEGYRFVHNHYSWEETTENLAQIMASAGDEQASSKNKSIK